MFHVILRTWFWHFETDKGVSCDNLHMVLTLPDEYKGISWDTLHMTITLPDRHQHILCDTLHVILTLPYRHKGVSYDNSRKTKVLEGAVWNLNTLCSDEELCQVLHPCVSFPVLWPSFTVYIQEQLLMCTWHLRLTSFTRVSCMMHTHMLLQTCTIHTASFLYDDTRITFPLWYMDLKSIFHIPSSCYYKQLWPRFSDQIKLMVICMVAVRKAPWTTCTQSTAMVGETPSTPPKSLTGEGEEVATTPTLLLTGAPMHPCRALAATDPDR